MSIPDRPLLREEVVLREIEGEYVAYDPVSDRTVLLNVSAAAVLELCDGSRTAGEISSEIRRAFEAPAAVAEQVCADVDRTIEEFARAGLLARPAG